MCVCMYVCIQHACAYILRTLTCHLPSTIGVADSKVYLCMCTSIVNILSIYIILQYKIRVYEIRKSARTHTHTHTHT